MSNFEIVCWCAYCGAELESGSLCYHLDGQYICPGCLGVYAQTVFRWALEVVV